MKQSSTAGLVDIQHDFVHFVRAHISISIPRVIWIVQMSLVIRAWFISIILE
ncbi:MAG: hypothetical protein ACI9XC_001883 [Gammaproteobacteria bacterium]|jgi:hypothetical protein